MPLSLPLTSTPGGCDLAHDRSPRRRHSATIPAICGTPTRLDRQDWWSGARARPRPWTRFAGCMKNALEDIISEIFEELRHRDAGFCSCAQCRDDAILHALNKARPRYISKSLIGSAVTRVALSQGGVRAEIAVLVLEAMRKVASHPRHDVTGAVGGAA
jgi:Late competence development protein ComFB